MKIAAPIVKPEEVEPLAAAGADEFYCGVVPHEWAMRFGTSTLNRRRGGNLSSLEELQELVDRAHALDRTVSVALNAQHYSAQRWDTVLDLVGSLDGLGVDAVIVGDVGLLAALGQVDLRCQLHVSSIASCHNSQAAAFFRELGASRIILPRHVTLAETRRLISSVADVEWEAFVLNDGCVFEEGSCHTVHLPSAMGGPICLDDYDYRYRRVDGAEPDPAERGRIAENEEAYRSWLWFTFSCGFSLTEDGLPYGPCGLCAVPLLEAAGIATFKIAGREGNLPRRLRSVEMVKAVVDRVAAGTEFNEVAAFSQGMRNEPELCASGYMCYYREVLRTRRADRRASRYLVHLPKPKRRVCRWQ